MIVRRSLLAFVTLSLAFAPALPASAKSVRAKHHAGGGSWDGRWAGAWGGNDPTAIIVKGNRVVAYEYGGQTNAVSSSHVTATRISYSGGSNVMVSVTRTGANTAHATIKTGQGNGTAELTRQ